MQTEANSYKVAYGDKSEINCKHAYNHIGMNQVHHR